MNDLKGKKFGRLTVGDCAGVNAHGDATWNCLCDCGKKVVVAGCRLKSGNTKSCGCLWQEMMHNRKRRSNNVYASYNGKTKLLLEWCYDLKINYNSAYKRLKAGKPSSQVLGLPSIQKDKWWIKD